MWGWDTLCGPRQEAYLRHLKLRVMAKRNELRSWRWNQFLTRYSIIHQDQNHQKVSLFTRAIIIISRSNYLVLQSWKKKKKKKQHLAEIPRILERHHYPSMYPIIIRQPNRSSWSINLLVDMKPLSSRLFLSRPAIRRAYQSRKYAVQAPGAPTLQVFNRHTKWLQKERAAADVERSRQTDYLKDEIAMRLSERLLVCWKCYGIEKLLRNY